ncbi:MAG: hypothetical protein WCH35_07710 [Comamonadaceae bacterium]
MFLVYSQRLPTATRHGGTDKLAAIKSKPTWDKAEMVELFNEMIPDFAHKETGKYLDGRM